MISATNIYLYLERETYYTGLRMMERESKCHRVLTIGELGEGT